MFKYNSKDMLEIESSFPLRTVHFLAFCTMLYKILRKLLYKNATIEKRNRDYEREKKKNNPGTQSL